MVDSTSKVSAAEVERLRREFRERFGGNASGAEPRVFRAPGRVNLIGEHTDYTDGFVMPVAIDLHAWVAARPREDGVMRVHSLNVGETAEIDLANVKLDAPGHWSAYILGVAAALADAGVALRGADLLVDGKVPWARGFRHRRRWKWRADLRCWRWPA